MQRLPYCRSRVGKEKKEKMSLARVTWLMSVAYRCGFVCVGGIVIHR